MIFILIDSTSCIYILTWSCEVSKFISKFNSRFIVIVVNWKAEMACWRWIFVCTVFEKITKFERERERGRERVFTENGHVLVVKLSRTVQFCKQIELSWKGVDCLFVAPGFHSFSIMEKSRLARFVASAIALSSSLLFAPSTSTDIMLIDQV